MVTKRVLGDMRWVINLSLKPVVKIKEYGPYGTIIKIVMGQSIRFYYISLDVCFYKLVLP